MNENQYVSADLVRKAQAGDKQALDDLIFRSKGLILAPIKEFHLISEAKELLPEIRLKIYEKLSQLRDPEYYPGWLTTMVRNQCKNLLARRSRMLSLNNRSEGGDEADDPQKWLDKLTFGYSYQQFRKFEASLEHKERVQKIARAVKKKTFELVDKVSAGKRKLGEPVKSDGKKKTSAYDEFRIARAWCILEEANEDWNEANYEEVRNKLSIIISFFNPRDDKKEKKFLLASALSRMGDINQVQGLIDGPDKSIDFYLRARDIWDSLKDNNMAFYAVHMMGICYGNEKNYPKAVKCFEAARQGFKGNDELTRQWRGELESDAASCYFNMSDDMKSVQRLLDRALPMLAVVERRESYLAALRNQAKVEIRLGHLDNACRVLNDSVRDLPPYRALHHLQTKIAKIALLLLGNDIGHVPTLVSEAEAECKKFGYHHQLSVLHEIFSHLAIMRPH